MEINKFEARVIFLILRGMDNEDIAKFIKPEFDHKIDAPLVEAIRQRIIIRLDKIISQ